MASTTSSLYNLSRFVALASGDILVGCDVSDATQSPQGSDLGITVANFFATVPVPTTITSTTTPQLNVNYDGTHGATFSVSAAGLLTINATTTVTVTPATTFSSTVTAVGKITAQTTANAAFQAASATTSASYVNISNTSGDAVFGVENSAGGGLVTGSSAYATIVGSNANKALDFFTNAIRRGGFSAAGAFDVTGALAVAGAVSGVTTLAASGTVTLTATGTSIAASGDISVATTKKVSLNAGGTIYLSDTGSGAVALNGATSINFGVAGTVPLTLDTTVRIGVMSSTNASAMNICITSSSAPTGNPTGGGFLWVEAGVLKYRGTSGTVTTIANA